MYKATAISPGSTNFAVAVSEAGEPAAILNSEGNGSTPLSKDEIGKAPSDAQSPAEEDRRRREESEARNNADSMAYQVERQIRELGDSAPTNEKAHAEQLISEIRELIKNRSTDTARLRRLSSALQQAGYGMSVRPGQNSGSPKSTYR
jgi:molecular chaperone DnaK